MYISLNQPGAEIKTMRSQFSNIDMFSKLQSSFLEKFFKYNLTDYHQQLVTNIYENVFDRKLKQDQSQEKITVSKVQKYVASSLFIVEKKFTVEEFERKIQRFYQERSSSISKNDLPYAFKLKHNNFQTVPNLFKSDELIFVDVKIKADVQKIQQIPQKIIKYFQHYRLAKRGKLSKLQQLLTNYRQEYFNIFIVYFGDCNFQLFDQKGYQVSAIKLMGKFYKLRIFAFFVSKQALIETFRTVNKIKNLDYINDLVIQFYELKRQKQRRKRAKKSNKNTQKHKIQTQSQSLKQKIYMFIGVFGLVGFGFAIKKLLK